MSAQKLNIELSTYDAVSILSFCQEWFNSDNRHVMKYRAMHEALDRLEFEIYSKVTMEQAQECCHENQVNQLIGKSPKT